MKSNDISLKKEFGCQLINKGGDQVAEIIASSLPKPETTGGKILWDLGAMVLGFGLNKILRDKNGNLSESDRRFSSAVQRGLHRRKK